MNRNRLFALATIVALGFALPACAQPGPVTLHGSAPATFDDDSVATAGPGAHCHYIAMSKQVSKKVCH